MSRTKGFTLVELLVVVGIIALLISVLMPALRKARIAANQTACLARHRDLGMALQMYVNSYKGHAPPYEWYDPATGMQFYKLWPSADFLGRFVGQRKYNNKDSQIPGVELYMTRGITCSAYLNPRGNTLTYITGIGINIRNAWFKRFNDNARRRFGRPSNPKSARPMNQVITFVDTFDGGNGAYRWEKLYYGDSSTATGGGANGMVAYRHGRNTVVSFADGHAAVFTNQNNSTVGYNSGLHGAYNAGGITVAP